MTIDAVDGGWYPISMKKTSLYLDPEVDAALARIANKRGITKAELIRQSLRDLAADEERSRITAIGIGRGPGDVSSRVDEHLSDTEFGR